MSKVVIYKQESGLLSVFFPSPEALKSLGITKIAPLVVPVGRPYKIIESSDLPEDQSQRDAWTVEDSELTDGVGVMK